MEKQQESQQGQLGGRKATVQDWASSCGKRLCATLSTFEEILGGLAASTWVTLEARGWKWPHPLRNTCPVTMVLCHILPLTHRRKDHWFLWATFVNNTFKRHMQGAGRGAYTGHSAEVEGWEFRLVSVIQWVQVSEGDLLSQKQKQANKNQKADTGGSLRVWSQHSEG